jgi:GT2 family glycosyltransferase
MSPRLAFLIVSYNTCELLDACLASVYRHTQGIPFEVIVVDNSSRDGSVAMVRNKYSDAIVLESGENLGFGRANNLGFARSRAPFVMLLNSDALLQDDAGSALVQFLEEHPDAGIVGPDVVLMDGTRQTKTRGMLPSGRVMINQNLLLSRLFPRSRFFAGLYVETDWSPETRIGWVSGVCMTMRREAYEECGGFDPNIFMYAEDIDLCRRCGNLGWETWRVGAHPIKHLCGGSTKTTAQALNNRVLQQRNFLRMLDASLGPIGRASTRASFGVGLMLRSLLRGCAVLVGGRGRKLAFKSDLRCLADLFGMLRATPEETHAHRN